MKTIIFFALVGACVALQRHGRKHGFSFPGKPVQAVISAKRSLELPVVDASSEQKSHGRILEQENFVLSNPHRRNIRLGGQNLPQFGFHAAIQQDKQPEPEAAKQDSSAPSPVEENTEAVNEQKSSSEEGNKDDSVSSSEEQANEDKSVAKEALENQDSAVSEEKQAEPPKLFNRFSFIHPRGQSLFLQGSRAAREISEDVPAGIELNPSKPIQGFSQSLSGNVRDRKQYKRVKTIRLVPK